MTWVYLDDKWDLSDKIKAVSDLAKIVWVRGLTHCRRNATQGFISEHSTEDFLSRKNFKLLPGCIEELCENHLTEDRDPLWVRVKGGFQMNDYGIWNDVEEELERRKKADRDRQAKWRSRHPKEKTKKPAEDNTEPNVSSPEHNVTHNVTVTPMSQPVTAPPARAIPIPFPIPDPDPDPPSGDTGGGAGSVGASEPDPKPDQRKRSGRKPSGEIPLPEDFSPAESTRAFAIKHGRDIDGVIEELRIWSDLGNTSKDWQARLRQFILSAEKRGDNPIRVNGSKPRPATTYPQHQIIEPPPEQSKEQQAAVAKAAAQTRLNLDG